MEKFRWAYIGNGSIAATTAAGIMKGDHAITAVYGRNTEKVRSFAEKTGAKAYTNVDEMLAQGGFDAVYIATPHTSHVECALKALERKIPVLCEKPVAVCAEDAQKLACAARKNETYFAEAMWTWFCDPAAQVKKWIDGGEIGKVSSVTVNYAFPGLILPKTSRVRTPETAGGALLDIGIYPITYCYNLFGYPDEISCEGEIKDGIDIAETVTLKYSDGPVCTLKMSLKTLKESCVIKGEKGKISVPMFHMARKATLSGENGRKIFRGRTDYLTEFTAVSREIKEGLKESRFVPLKATEDCLKIMDECRKQMKLVYPFEK